MTRRLEKFFSENRGPRRILALDGGGVRGLLTLGVLAQLEAELEQRSGVRDYRLSQYFDLIGGTSTGSIIATGLAFGWRVSKVWAAYRTILPKIFGRTAALGLLAPQYREQPLIDALTEFFGDETLGSEQLETGLAIFAKRMNSGSAWIFCNNPRWNFYDNQRSNLTYAPNRTFLLRSLVQASAAAPHYFRGVKITIETADERKNEAAYFVDGGVGGYNNPALELLTMVRHPAYGFNWDLGGDNIYLLSVGTGWVREKKRLGGGILKQLIADRVFLLQTISALRGMINDVSLQQVAYLQSLARVAMPWYINLEKRLGPGAPVLAPADAPALTYQRVDVRFDPDEDHTGQLLPDTAKALRGGTDLKSSQLKGLMKITNGKDKNADLLSELGRSAGARFIQLAPPPASFNPPSWVRSGDEGPGGRRD